MTTTKKIDNLQDLAQVTESETVEYITHGPHGQWPVFVERHVPVPTSDVPVWDMNTALRNLVAFVLDRYETPLVISQFHDSYNDPAPSYRVLCYDVPYQQLIALDTIAQPSWFKVEITPNGALYNVRLTPTRSLMKLLYKLVIE